MPNENDLRLTLVHFERGGPTVDEVLAGLAVNGGSGGTGIRHPRMWATLLTAASVAAVAIAVAHTHHQTSPSANATTSNGVLPCLASQLKVGQPSYPIDSGTANMSADVVQVSLTNTGSECLLVLPDSLTVTTTSGTSAIVRVNGDGTTALAAGAAQNISIEDSFPIPGHPEPCADQTNNVNYLELQLREGIVGIGLVTAWPSICSDPRSANIYFG